jgi:carbonic anhydrase/acetyltransferase-like protein (isoleucine patch superfamily)
MTVYALDGIEPEFEDRSSNFVADNATLAGKVRLGRDASIWFGATIRGDNEWIVVGARSNIQELTVMHTDWSFPLIVGEGCTVGHRAILHSCVIGENSLIGMGAILLNGAKIGRNSLVGAGALVTEGKEFPDNSLIVGVPAKVIRTLDEAAIEKLRASADHYVETGKRFQSGLKQL